jgi:hypothetical protein
VPIEEKQRLGSAAATLLEYLPTTLADFFARGVPLNLISGGQQIADRLNALPGNLPDSLAVNHEKITSRWMSLNCSRPLGCRPFRGSHAADF